MSDNYPHGLFSWADLASPDPKTAKEFYTGLFGWEGTDQNDPEGNYIYTLFTIGGQQVAGLGPQPEMMQGMPAVWNSYVNVDNVDEVVAKATDVGASVLVPAMDVMDTGRMAFLQDPGGAVFGVWEPGTHKGADTFTVPGSMGWNELATRQPNEAADFYGQVFPWSFNKMVSDQAPADYWTVHLDTKVDGDGDMDDDFNAGIMKMDENWPDDMPSHWMVYFRVESTDDAVEKVKDLGGTVKVKPFQTAAGKMSVIADPQGGTFSILDSPPSE